MLDANDQLRSVEAYRDLIIAYSGGAPLRLSDVAEVVDGAENTRLGAWANDQPAVLVNVQRQPAPTSSTSSIASTHCCQP